MKQTTEKLEKQSTGRSRYERPILMEFGLVGALTQSGTMGPAELVMDNGMCFMNQPPPPTTGQC